MMRRILINYAEAHNAAKRAGRVDMIPIEDAFGIFTDPRVDLLHLNTTLDRLSGIDPQQGRVVELRYFGGLSIEETAEVLGISPATVKREWSTARLWLMRQMQGGAVQ
jgi:RNA polymerase sigma factor (TIGR02999 family)